MTRSFDILEHTADIGFHAEADTLAELFEEAAHAMLEIAADRSAVCVAATRQIDVTGPNLADLLVNFLSELLYLLDADRFVPVTVAIESVTSTAVRARLAGEPRDPARHPWRLIVKAVTYHGLDVSVHDGRWHATVFLDV
jgi:SHS2 domain-containing protein